MIKILNNLETFCDGCPFMKLKANEYLGSGLTAYTCIHLDICKRVYSIGRDDIDRVAMVESELENIKQKPKGHWVKEESPYGWDGHSYQCSECGRSIHLDTEVEDLEDYPFCHCGAEMDNED